MKTWGVESLCMAIAAIVILMTGAVAVLAFGDSPELAQALLPLIALLGIAMLAALLRLRAVSLSRNSAHDRARSLQRRYNHFVNTAHEGIWIVDHKGSGVFANRRLAQMFGCAVNELLNCPVDDFLGENPRESLNALLSPDPAGAGRTFDLSYRRADGSVGWAIASGRPASAEDGLPGGTLLLLTDISERKAAELQLAAVQIGLEVRIRMRTAELQRANELLRVEVGERITTERALSESYTHLRQLTAHLETIKEEERKRIALDIHDDLGQNLMALKIDVQLLHGRCAGHPFLCQKVGHALDTIDGTIRSVRSIINDLHPSTLELGLPAATEWLVDQFEKRSGIAASLTVIGEDQPLPDQRLSAVIFRIIQESLINIQHHARATQVEVALAISELEVAVTIMDDGPGIHPGDADKTVQFVRHGIRERIDVFGGELSVTPRLGHGTCLSFRIPLGTPAELDQSWFAYNSKETEII